MLAVPHPSLLQSSIRKPSRPERFAVVCTFFPFEFGEKASFKLFDRAVVESIFFIVVPVVNGKAQWRRTDVLGQQMHRHMRL